MSLSLDLQRLIYERLVADPGVHALVRDRIYDRIPEKPFFPYLTFGPSDYIEDDADCITGVVETFTLNGWSRKQGGFKEIKEVDYAVKRALHLYDGALETHALVELRFSNTRFFRDPDGLTSQAAMQYQAIMEDALS